MAQISPEMKTATKRSSQKLDPMAKSPHPAARKCILLADDDPGVRGSLQEMLAEEGYEVIPANDGQEALDLIVARSIDIVLLDLNMPRKNGWDTFERLSAEHPLVPVILITARPNQLFTAVGAGVGALLEKPLNIPILLETIARLLAESVETRLARIAGHDTAFRYAAGKPNPPSKPGGSPRPPR
jgi:DNA-binding response OmpR family regulator